MTIQKKQLQAIVISVILGLSAAIPVVMSFFDKMGEVPYYGLLAGIWSGIFCIIILKVLSKTYPVIAAYPSLLIGVLFAAKPKLAPVMHNYGAAGGLEAFSYTSETHLYFAVPGVLLIIVSFFYLLVKD